MNFNPGDQVKQIAGGPSLAVVEFDEEAEMYICQWYDNKSNGFKTGHFAEAVLRNHVPAGPSVRTVR